MHQPPKQPDTFFTPEDHQAYGELSMRELARKLADAECTQSIQTAEVIGDVLLDKMIATEMEFSETGVEGNRQSDRLWKGVMKSYDKRVQKLGGVTQLSRAPVADVPQQPLIQDKLRTLAGDLQQLHDKWEALSQFDIESVAITRPRVEGEINGDTILEDRNLMVFGVFDGVSGEEGPDIASQEAMIGVHGYYMGYADNDPESEEEALTRAKEAIESGRVAVVEGGAGGTTATFLKIEKIKDRPHLVWGHAGDSPLILQRGKGNEVKIISTDQSVIERGQSYLYNGLFANRNYQQMMPDEFGVISLEIGDRIVLCSDGITGDTPKQKLTQAELREAFDMNDPKAAAHKLFRISKKRDDKSVVIVDIKESEPRNRATQPAANAAAAKGKRQSAYLAPGTPSGALEQRRKRRRKWAAAVLGAVAATGIALALITGGNEKSKQNGTTRAKPNTPPPANTANKQAEASARTQAKARARLEKRMEARHRAREAAEMREAAQSDLAARTLRLSVDGVSHTTIWGQSAQYLQEHGYLTNNQRVNDARIATVKNAVLHNQNLSEQDARSLPVGYTFTIPRWVLKQVRTTR